MPAKTVSYVGAIGRDPIKGDWYAAKVGPGFALSRVGVPQRDRTRRGGSRPQPGRRHAGGWHPRDRSAAQAANVCGRSRRHQIIIRAVNMFSRFRPMIAVWVSRKAAASIDRVRLTGLKIR
jgi:hypothetical protein